MAYDSSNQSIFMGGTREIRKTSLSYADAGYTWFDEDRPIIQDCTIGEIRLVVDKTGTAGSVEVYLLSESGGTYTVEEEVDLTSEFNALSLGNA